MILKHHFRHAYSQFLHLTDTQALLVGFAVVVFGLLSLLKPEFFKDSVARITRGLFALIRRKAVLLLSRFQLKRAAEGIWIGSLFIPDEARRRHMQILGATGMGKTVFMEHLIYGDIERGYGMLIIDPKGDRELYERVQEFCRKVGRTHDLHLLSATNPEESVRWNPCALGTVSQLQSKWFSSGTYENPFYASACELALIEAFDGLIADLESFTLGDLVARVKSIADKKKNEHTEGLSNELKNFAMSEWGELLCVSKPGRQSHNGQIVSLRSILRKNEILFVELPTEAASTQSSRMGKLLLMEMKLLSGIRKGLRSEKGRNPFSVYVDEFDAFATDGFATFFNKGRSSDFMVHLAHHTVGDLEKVSEHLKSVIMGICNTRAVFRSDGPDDADYLARLFGTRMVVKQTHRTDYGIGTGQSSNRDAEEFIVHPNRIKSLRIGECIFCMKSEQFLEVLRLPMPTRKPRQKFATERETPHVVSEGYRRLEKELDVYQGLDAAVKEPGVDLKQHKGGETKH